MIKPISLLLWLSSLPLAVSAAESTGEVFQPLNLTTHAIGFASLAIFSVAYILAMLEETTLLRKSKPMVFAASVIWVLIACIYVDAGLEEQSRLAFRSNLEGYAELFLFIMVSMTYLNAMEQRGVFDNLRIWLLSKGFGYRALFWITGVQSFLLSSVCNNLTTALLMGAVVMAMAKGSPGFISIACVNIVVATNAGGSFSPFGDITTLLVWQKGVVPFTHFFSLLVPALVNFVVPAAIMHFWIPKQQPKSAGLPQPLQNGAMGIIVLFALTIATAVLFENLLGLPPVAGMLAGLTFLSFYFFYLFKVRVDLEHGLNHAMLRQELKTLETPPNLTETKEHFDVFHSIAHLEWDTLLYFYGVMLSVGGLSYMGYLSLASDFLYTSGLDPTIANVLVGIVSAFIDNGTVMFAVLTMAPKISEGQWLLVTLTAGVGGSLLAIGSAAGVGLMGQSKGAYTFVSHLKWTPVIALGFAASIVAHFLINGQYFQG